LSDAKIVIGLTLVVAADSYFGTLFAVIVFHQAFEGIALGSVIAQLPIDKIPFIKKASMGLAFALTTPVGMVRFLFSKMGYTSDIELGYRNRRFEQLQWK